MATRLVPDFPAVLVALEHIKELDKELKYEGVAFSPEASVHLAEITCAITGLEAERRAAHEHLEVATIENSKLRHEMNNTRDQMSAVIMADVNAARASNAEEIEQLRKDLHAVSQIQEATVKKHELIVSENELLSVERDKMKAKYEEVIAALNNERTQKYTLQSQLDQTRETIDNLKASTASCEHNMLTLQHDLALEKEAFIKCRHDLSKEFEENEEKINHKKQEILRSKKELEMLNESKRNDSDSLDDLRIQTIQLESSIQRLKACKSDCEKDFEAEKEKYKVLTTQKEALEFQLNEMIKAFNKAIAAQREEIATIEERMVGARAARAHIQEALAKVYEVFKVHDDEETEVRTEYDFVSGLMEKSRMQLEECIASIVRHKKEIIEMEKQIEGLKEDDVINKRVFERDQKEFCGSIDVQKQNTKALEDEQRQLQKNLKEQKNTQEEYVKKMTANIKFTWRRVKELQTEDATLKQKQPMSPDEIKHYIERCKAEYEQIESLCREEIKQCMNEIVMNHSEEKQKEVEEKEKILEEVEATWRDAVARFEQLKRQEAEFRMKKRDLEESIDMLKNETIKILKPKEEKKVELERTQAEHMDQVRKQAADMKFVEMCIYDSSVKLEQVQMENSRLQLHIRQMTEDMNKSKEDKKRYREEAEQLKQDSKILFRSLQEAWRDEIELTQERHCVDAALEVPMGALQNHLRTRGRHLGHVQALLHEHMLDFSRRLGDKITVEPQS
ncbi:centromere-associated protein E [Periophthalmus magnuspinnatus]|uniref:centromere-associated protein E n=1 Tax=Periophthalmus magnuspinnatus TaxID=409849 RepID=UPI00145BD698|nr:centromere-associated protein E [Periophthalmus magnuspinnatus]